jgi:hypothetical protein
MSLLFQTQEEEKLEDLIKAELKAYINECDLDEDRSIDCEDFAKETKKLIEDVYGDRFDDYNISSYAKSIAETYLYYLAEEQALRSEGL